MSPQITVPDLISLSFAQARAIGAAGGIDVQGVNVDGTPVEPDCERIVIDQDPLAGDSLGPGDVLVLRVGRPHDDSGDRQPVSPPPTGHQGDVDPAERLTSRDPNASGGQMVDDDPDLVPA